MAAALIEDLRIHYVLDGTPDAPVLVLSHGLGLALGMWDAQMAVLRAHFRVLRYDTRGHGASAVPPGPSSIEDLGREVVALLDHLDIRRAHFCGLSLGAMTGMWLGVHAPERIASLVLANTAPRVGAREMWEARIDMVNAHGMTSIADAAIARWFTPEFIAASPAAVAGMKRMFERTPAAGYVSCCAATRDADLTDAVTRIQAPTLVIAGRRDVATPPGQADRLAGCIPGARYVELPTAHLSNVEMPDVFAELICDHLGCSRATASRVAA